MFFLLGPAIFSQPSFNSSAFLDIISIQLNVTIDKMRLAETHTVDSGLQVVVRVHGSTAWERDYLSRWFKSTYVIFLAKRDRWRCLQGR
jgi:hypothetical protein